MQKKRKTRAELEAERQQARESAAWLRELAEKALSELPPSVREERERAGSNAAWLRQLAEQAQADFDSRRRGDA